MKEEPLDFVWDVDKEVLNLRKHGVDFTTAARAFKDPGRKIFRDAQHSSHEERLFCIGQVGKEIITVRFTYRAGKIRIFGAGLWRKGRSYYEKG
jgi:uncharacterized protein